MTREAEVRRYVRQYLLGPTPVGILTLSDDIDAEETLDLVTAVRREASKGGTTWPPIIVGQGMGFVATHQPSRRYAGRKLLQAIREGERVPRRGETR